MMSVAGGPSAFFCGLFKEIWSCYNTKLYVTPFVFFAVVQRVDSVSEGIASYGGKIIAVETDLKKLGTYLLEVI